MKTLSKTDFIHYLNCSNSLWLKKNKTETFNKYEGELSLFLEKIIKDGYEVEAYAEKLFSNPIKISLTYNDKNDHEETARILETNKIGNFFQPTFLTNNGLLARADILQKNEDGSFNIYEVKSSTKIKKDKKHNHLKDICFQKFIMEDLGYKIRDCFIIHLNGKFKKNGEILPEELLEKELVNDEILELFEEVKNDIITALNYIKKEKINENLCSCLEKTRSNHCDTFKYFNPNIILGELEYIHNLNRISESKIKKLLDLGVYKIQDIPEDFDLSEKQVIQKQSLEIKKPVADWMEIKKTLDKLVFPLYFFDYETIPSAIPKVEDFSPHQHLPFQFSLHILEENGNLTHKEYLAEKFEKPEKLILFMKEVIGKSGNLISWFAPFEKTQNKKMIEMFPEHKTFLEDINNRTFDLMDIFKIDYIDYKFNGSTSIKKVLPVFVPDKNNELDYKSMEVSDGAAAIEQGERMLSMTDCSEREEIRKNLLKYCKLDTFAMVRIWQVLKEKI